MNEQEKAQLQMLVAEVESLKAKVASHANRLHTVEARVNGQLVNHIQTDVSSGMKSKDVAAKHSVSPLFVSHVAPRRQFAPGAKQQVQ